VSSSNKVYYYHRATGATTWQRPAADVASESDDSELDSSDSDSGAAPTAPPAATAAAAAAATAAPASAGDAPLVSPREERGPLKIESDEAVARKKKRQDSFVAVLQHMATMGVMPAPNVILAALAQNGDDVDKTVEMLSKAK
jgi:hypothetical protein